MVPKLPRGEVHFRNFSEATVVNESFPVTKIMATVLRHLQTKAAITIAIN